MIDEALQRAANAIDSADALLIGAGAGMGVDSGLPDFRSNQGFWRAYPPFRALGLDFPSLANPRWFSEDPTLAWGFYGHRLELYRSTQPHDGFQLLRRWAAQAPLGSFVLTTNVDGQFQKGGVDPDRVYEVHGSIHWMQCLKGCGVGLFPAEKVLVQVDAGTMRAREPLPSCPRCGALARPNILMFEDWGWDETRAEAQGDKLRGWLRQCGRGRLAIVECGAGNAIPTVRRNCEALASAAGATLIRVNPSEPEVPAGHIGLAMGALEGLRAIDARLRR